MRPDDQRGTSPAAASRRSLDPKLERTLIAAGWRPEDLRSPTRSPLANLRVTDLAATVAVAPLDLPGPDGGPARAGAADPNDTRRASDWTWMDALAAMSGADPQTTLITPSRRSQSRPTRDPAADLDLTRIAPWSASDLLPAESMTAPAAATAEAPAAAPPELAQLPDVPDRPALMPGVELLGTLRDTGFAEQQWLAQRGADFVQLSELLYRVLEQVDGARTLDEIAANVRAVTGRPVSANNVRLLIAARLLPLGLVVPVDGIPAAAPSATRSPLAITLRLGFVSPAVIDPIARVLQVLFWPPLLIPLVLLIAVGQAWLFFVHGLAAPVRAALAEPLVLAVISGFILASAVFHEFGHASALRYGGGRARGIGFGIYFVYPAFYTDCTESYRLGRWGRLRTDLGGIYFDLIVTLGLVALYVLTRQEVLLVAVLLLDAEILDQFSPIMRYDGYWALADLVGVPDFFTLMKPVLRSTLAPLLRWRSRKNDRKDDGAAGSDAPVATAPISAPALKGWVRVAFLAYTAVTVPLVYAIYALLLGEAPTLLGFYGDSLVSQVTEALAAGARHQVFAAVIAWGQVAILILTAAILLYGVGNLARSLVRGMWAWGRATQRRRVISFVVLVAGLVVLALVWRGQLVVLIPHFAQLPSHFPKH